jgi:hypothetical protein
VAGQCPDTAGSAAMKHLFFDAQRNGVEARDGGIVQLPPLARILAPQPLGAGNLVGNGTAYDVHVLLAQPLQLAVELLHGGVCSVRLGEDVGELAQRHEVAQGGGRQQEVGEELGLGGRHGGRGAGVERRGDSEGRGVDTAAMYMEPGRVDHVQQLAGTEKLEGPRRVASRASQHGPGDKRLLCDAMCLEVHSPKRTYLHIYDLGAAAQVNRRRLPVIC